MLRPTLNNDGGGRGREVPSTVRDALPEYAKKFPKIQHGNRNFSIL